MSAVVHHDYASAAQPSERTWTLSSPLRRLVIAAAGCAVMALSGGGLASYLDTSPTTGADAGVSPADAATLSPSN